MNINSDLIWQNYRTTRTEKEIDSLNKNAEVQSENEKLKALTEEFTSILMKQMFKAMRKTIPENKMLDGGFAEDVFTDMLDDEISTLGAKRDGFNTLSRLLYEELRRKE